MTPPANAVPTSEVPADAGDSTVPDTAEIEDLLIEEVSIDGLCGVY